VLAGLRVQLLNGLDNRTKTKPTSMPTPGAFYDEAELP
jgi:hypothetical protein